MRPETRLARIEKRLNRPPVDLAALLESLAGRPGLDRDDAETIWRMAADLRQTAGREFVTLLHRLSEEGLTAAVAAMEAGGVSPLSQSARDVLPVLEALAEDAELSNEDRHACRAIAVDARACAYASSESVLAALPSNEALDRWPPIAERLWRERFPSAVAEGP